MPLTRRSFVVMAAVATVGVGFVGVNWIGRRLDRLGSLGTLPTPAPPQTETLGDRAEAVLNSAVEALLGPDVDRDRYMDCFRWRAENIDGLNANYAEFAEWADSQAMRAFSHAFDECTPDERRQVLDGDPPSRRVPQEILNFYALTDAWVAVGYDDWPGSPRGLDSYVRQPG